MKRWFFIACILLVACCLGALAGCSTSLLSDKDVDVPEFPVYALNLFSRSVSILDGESESLRATFKLSETSEQIQLLKDDSLLIQLKGRLERVNSEIGILAPPQFNVKDKIELRYPAEKIFYDRDSELLVVGHTFRTPAGFSFSLVDTKKRKVVNYYEVPGILNGAGFDGGRILLYAAGPSSAGMRPAIYGIDRKSGKLEVLVPLEDIHGFHHALFYKDKLFGVRSASSISNRNLPFNHTLWAIRVPSSPSEKAEIEQVVKLGNNPHDIIVVGDELYVSHYNRLSPVLNETKVSILDLNTLKVKEVLDVGLAPASLCYFAPKNQVYTANMRDHSISIIDVAQKKVVKTIKLTEKTPFDLACSNG